MKSWSIIKKIALTLALVINLPVADAARMRPNHPRPGTGNVHATQGDARPSKQNQASDSLSTVWFAHQAGDLNRDYNQITVTNDNVASYLSGFTIPANTIVVWNVADNKKLVNGPIVFKHATSTLILNNNLYLGAKGGLSSDFSLSGQASGPFLISIYGNSKTIFMSANLTLPDYSLVNSSDLTIDGGGKTFTAHKFYGFNSTVTLKNMALNVDIAVGNGALFSGGNTTLDAVTIQSSASNLWLCGPSDADTTLTTKNQVIFAANTVVSRYLVNNGTLINNGIFALNSNHNIVNSGTIKNNGVVALPDGVSITGPAMTGAAAVPLLQDGSSIKTSGGTFTPDNCANGFVVIGSGIINDDVTVGASGNVAILPSAILQVATGTRFVNNGKFLNMGTLALPLGAKIGAGTGVTGAVAAGSLATLRAGALKSTLGGYLVPVLEGTCTIAATGGVFTPADCADGFVIPASSTVTWNDGIPAKTKINGPIAFAAGSSILKLASDLLLGVKGNFTGSFSWDDAINIDGQSHSIVLGGDVNVNNGQYCWISLYSPLTIDGGAAKSNFRGEDFDGFWISNENNPVTLTLKNMAFTFAQNDNSYGTFGIPLTMNNVTVKSLYELPSNLMDYGCLLTIQGTVNLTGPWLRLGYSYDEDTNFSVTIAPNATLKCDGGTVEACNFDDNGDTCTITLADKTSTLQLSNASFYTGGNGLILDTGKLQYSGNVNLFVGDRGDSFIPGGTLTLDSSLTPVVDQKALVSVSGAVVQVIEDVNAASYLKGFTIPANTTYAWNCSPSQVVTGAISGKDNLTSQLQLNTSMFVASQSLIGTSFAVSGLGDNSLRVLVDSKNTKDFVTDFTVKPNTTVVWNRGTTPLAGSVALADATSRFELASDLYFGANGAVDIPFAANGNTVYTSKKKKLVVGINDANYARYKNGFTIPDGVTYEWAATGPLRGPITFASDSSVLKLGQDLHLGAGGDLVADYVPTNNTFLAIPFVAIDANGKGIVLDCDYSFAGQAIKFEGDLTIDGQGHEFGLPVACFAGDSMLTLKNMKLAFGSDDTIASPQGMLGVGFFANQMILEDVVLKAQSLKGNIVCGVGCPSLVIRGNVVADCAGKQMTLTAPLSLFGDKFVSVAVDKNSTLHVGSGVDFIFSDLPWGFISYMIQYQRQDASLPATGIFAGIDISSVVAAVKATVQPDRSSGLQGVLLSMANATSVLHLEGCDFSMPWGPLEITTGTVMFDRRVNLHTKPTQKQLQDLFNILQNLIGALALNAPSNTKLPLFDLFSNGILFGDGSNPAHLLYLSGATVTVDGTVIVDSSVAAPTTREWSWLTYMQADNNFSSGGTDFTSGAINAMKDADVTDNLNILVQRDMANGIGTERYKISGGQLTDAGSLSTEMGNDPKQELIESMRWVKERFPANNYVLMLWDHGNGVLDGWGNRGFENKRGILYDYSQGTFVDNADLKNACAQIKTNIGKNIGVLGMDACEMAMIEVAYQIRDFVDYMVASQQLSWSWASSGSAWAFGNAMESLSQNQFNSSGVATGLVASCAHFYSGIDSSIKEPSLGNLPIKNLYTMSAINLSKVTAAVGGVQAVASAINALQTGSTKAAMNKALEIARAASQHFYHTDDNGVADYVDLVDFYNQLLIAVNASTDLTTDQKMSITIAVAAPTTGAKDCALAAVAANAAGSTYGSQAPYKANGLSLYFPKTTVKASYMDTDFAQSGAPQWVTVLNNRQ